jgi:hypothetical protein
MLRSYFDVAAANPLSAVAITARGLPAVSAEIGFIPHYSRYAGEHY